MCMPTTVCFKCVTSIQGEHSDHLPEVECLPKGCAQGRQPVMGKQFKCSTCMEETIHILYRNYKYIF